MTATTEWAPPEAEPSALVRLVRRRPWAGPALVGAGLAVATTYVALRDPYRGGGLVPACPLKELTGLDCPGCGGTRAVHALVHGDLGTALDHNVLLTILVPLLGLLWALWLVRSLLATRDLRRARRAGDEAAPGGAPPPENRRVLIPYPSARAWIAIGAIAVAFAIVRNVDAIAALEYLGSDAAGKPTPG